ncbi:hypothetical protein GCM10010885_11300 [Alicyclobacillus cellulosilyticus]|uniref:Glycoside hydrolase family 127 protein n=1 Tax=Alicyclobacillus cellulosilyticus TaxID=1003997 RepID=A0A917K8G1_9BACL|nr:beta-L-arabinofuranosidase domain-containing protein [Alicyclobacillus cellulosilyticus]GGJ03790.1 hypothetical protein GCM10010885_11300 [Alicyclobacillus cellulosilyticus]
MKRLLPVSLQNVHLEDDFWAPRQQLVRDVVVPYQWKALNDELPDVEPSHTVANLKIAAGEMEGTFHGMVFQDSDLYKWLETVGYVLAIRPNPELEALADGVIDLLARAQQPDGYLNSYFTVARPDARWTNLRDDHELYCAGHLMEAAVAYYQATGKPKILDIVRRLAEHIDRVLGPEPGKKRGYCGHPEIELALMKLHRLTGDELYLRLAKYFVDERGREPLYFALEAEARGEKRVRPYNFKYSQSHQPVREQTSAEGHAVRAVYLYSGMADVAAETDDEALLAACRRLWEDIVSRRMYVTGGIGSSAYEEAFTVPYDLPNDRAYAETCAAIGLVFFSHRMLQLEADAKYADVMERALYNGVLSGMSLDGQRYFYVNPLEVWPEVAEHREDMHAVRTTRQPWFGCACCPPNIARLLASLGGYIYSVDPDTNTAFVHLYIGSQAAVSLAGQDVRLIQRTRYPWDGEVQLQVSASAQAEFAIALRVPGWARRVEVRVNGQPVASSWESKGYVYIRRVWRDGDTVTLSIPMPVEEVFAHPEVRMNAGKLALQRGPIVYCLEEVDNGRNLQSIVIRPGQTWTAQYEEGLLGGVVTLQGSGWRDVIRPQGEAVPREFGHGQPLYAFQRCAREETKVKAIPYYAWCNRTPGEMTVWVRYES